MKKELTFLGILSLSFILLNLSNANIFDDIGKSFTEFGNKIKNTGEEAINETKNFFQNLNPQQLAQNTADKILGTFGINLTTLINSAQAMQSGANHFSPLINRLQEIASGTNGPIDTASKVQNNIHTIQNSFADVISKSQTYLTSGQFLILLNALLSSLKGLTASADQAIAAAPNTIQSDLITIKQEIISLNNTLNNNQTRVLISEVKEILQLIGSLLNAAITFRNSGGALSQVILNNTLMGHINDVKVDIANLESEINIILATPVLDTIKTTESIIMGIFNNIQAVPKLVENIKPQIEQIIGQIPTITQYPAKIEVQVTSLINFTKTIGDTLKQQVMNVLKPEIIVDPARTIAVADGQAQAALQKIFTTLHIDVQGIFTLIHSFLTDIQGLTHKAVAIEENINTSLAIRLLPAQTVNAIEGFVNGLDKLLHDIKPLLP